MFHPIPHRQATSDEVNSEESHHAPEKSVRVLNPKHGMPELNGEQTQYRESDSASNEIKSKEAQPWIVQRSRSGDGQCERKGRRCKGGEDDSQTSMICNRGLHLLEPLQSRHLADAFFSKFARDHSENKDSKCRAAGSGKNVERQSAVISRHKRNNHKIVSERQKQKRRVECTHDERRQIAKLEKQPQERAKEGRHNQWDAR